ncbi:MAG: MFS transporter [Oscillospiraceae bacterium]|nr:MFS transporter [Oscillospiraceae bacterium]
MAKNNVKRFLLLFALGVAYGFMYVMPYMKSSFYDQMIAAMGCTNAQLGSLMTYYTIALTISYLPGGWIGDKFNPKPVLLASIFGQAILSFLFMFTYQSYTMAVIIWCLMALTGGFAFWPSLMKGIRMTGTDEEQGRIFGIFEALNGCASLLLSFIMLGIMAIAGAGDLVTGFKSAVACMGGLSIVSGLLILFLMPKDATYGATEEEKAATITVRDYIDTFKIPGVWIMAILVWCYVTVSAVASYLTPYSTNVLGMSAVLAASIGTIRTYGCRLIGGPLGGFLADKAFHSVSKEQVLGQLACLVTLGIFLIIPSGINGTVLVVLLLLVGVAMFLCKGTYFSVQPELGIPTTVSATAVSIATLIGYLPDMFVHTMFGNWIDTYGNAGYSRIIMYGVGTCVLGAVAAIIAVRQSKKVRERAEGAAV